MGFQITAARDGWARMSESVSESEIQISSKSVPSSDAMILFESASDINFGHGLGHMSDVAFISDFSVGS